LHVRGRDVTADLSASLRAGGVKIRDSIVYAAEAASELPSGVSRQIAEGGFQTAAFYSPRTAKVFASLLDPAIRAGLGGTVAAAISQEAQNPLISLGFRRSEIAASPDGAAMLDLLARMAEGLARG
jgi:uroporphyrinogen-III synthase